MHHLLRFAQWASTRCDEICRNAQTGFRTSRWRAKGICRTYNTKCNCVKHERAYLVIMCVCHCAKALGKKWLSSCQKDLEQQLNGFLVICWDAVFFCLFHGKWNIFSVTEDINKTTRSGNTSLSLLHIWQKMIFFFFSDCSLWNEFDCNWPYLEAAPALSGSEGF